ncbi:MAG: DUF1543 domain-containing protein [Alphaproteobacteria bacterium]
MKLFAFYIGGRTATSLIELHDVRIVAGNAIEDCYDHIRDTWWGTPESLHLDCWGELTSADGHNITLREEPSAGADKLWFVNLGGYNPDDFNEPSKNIFVVAPTESKAKVRALKTILDWKGHHKDHQYEVETLACLNDIVGAGKWHIHLEKSESLVPFTFQYGFNPAIRKAA